MLKASVLSVAFIFLINRLFLGIEHYQRLSIERQNDLYVSAMCNQLDYKMIGRHASLCADLERRLKHSVLFETTKTLIEDTLYREASLSGLLQISLFLFIFLMMGNIYNKYVKVVDYNLPVTKNKEKIC